MNQHQKILPAADRILAALVIAAGLGERIVFWRRCLVVPARVRLARVIAVNNHACPALA